MTKAELVSIIAEKTNGVSKAEIGYIYDMVWETMIRSLEVDKRYQVSGFGTFELKDRPERQGRNPKTGESITIAASRKLAFRPAAQLKKRLMPASDEE